MCSTHAEKGTCRGSARHTGCASGFSGGEHRPADESAWCISVTCNWLNPLQVSARVERQEKLLPRPVHLERVLARKELVHRLRWTFPETRIRRMAVHIGVLDHQVA